MKAVTNLFEGSKTHPAGGQDAWPPGERLLEGYTDGTNFEETEWSGKTVTGRDGHRNVSAGLVKN